MERIRNKRTIDTSILSTPRKQYGLNQHNYLNQCITTRIYLRHHYVHLIQTALHIQQQFTYFVM
jgi:hypothetical protein